MPATHVTDLLTAVHHRQEAFRKARDMFRDRLAPDFNPFRFIDTRETRLSEILAWLLEPTETHGQGDRFLAAFLQRLGQPWDAVSTAGVKVCREAVITANRRIDILLEGRGWALAIENKPWAGDQRDQVRDYLTYVRGRGTPHGLLYLSGQGEPPSEESLGSRLVTAARR